MDEQNVLQRTLDWYLDNLSPHTKIYGIKNSLSKIQENIRANHINDAIESLIRIYNILPKQIKAQIPYPGPTPEFRQLANNYDINRDYMILILMI